MKVLAIGYLSTFTVSYVTSNTGAGFNDVELIENKLHTNWQAENEFPPDDNVWEKSSLKEVSQGGSCAKGIFATFTNGGESVNHELTKFEVYWGPEEKSVKTGEVISAGTFPIPNHNETYQLDFQPTKNGYYKFKAYHETGHPGGSGPWSETISITDCVSTAALPENSSTVQEITNLHSIVEATHITFTWNKPANDYKSIKIYRDGILLTEVTSQSYVDEGLTPASTYKYKFVVVDSQDVESNGQTVELSTVTEQIDMTAPSEISNLSVNRKGNSSNVLLDWAVPADKDLKAIRIYLVKAGSEKVLLNELGPTITSLEAKIEQEIGQNLIVTTIDQNGNESTGITYSIN